MHQGVGDFLRWLEDHPRFPGLWTNAPALAAELQVVEHGVGSPFPDDLRQVLLRFDGGLLPSGQLLSAGPRLWPNIAHALATLAKHFSTSPDDPNLLLPFYRNEDGGLLAFDRSGGPVADTWPIVDYYLATGDVRLVYRTFDGWCRHCVSEWSAPDYGEPFGLHRYLKQGERHAQIEPDVATAHATVAHALRRAGEPERAMGSYLEAARCVPCLPWCDWEALKLAVLLGREAEALESAARLAAPAPQPRWRDRETTPCRVSDVIARIAAASPQRDDWLMVFDQLARQAAGEEDRTQITAVRKAVFSMETLPEPRAIRPSIPPGHSDMERWWKELREQYRQGSVRDEDLLLDPELAALRLRYDLSELLRIRREF